MLCGRARLFRWLRGATTIRMGTSSISIASNPASVIGGECSLTPGVDVPMGVPADGSAGKDQNLGAREKKMKRMTSIVAILMATSPASAEQRTYGQMLGMGGIEMDTLRQIETLETCLYTNAPAACAQFDMYSTNHGTWMQGMDQLMNEGAARAARMNNEPGPDPRMTQTCRTMAYVYGDREGSLARQAQCD